MKNIIRISVIAVILTGCSGFLDEKLGTSYDKSSMISTPDALESAVLGIHHQMAACGFKDNPFCEFLATGSGLAIWGNTGAIDNPQQRWASLHRFTRYSNHPEAYTSFRNFYRTIYLCNHFLDIVKESPVDEEYVDKIVGEVYFVRAMAYFYLVRIWGDVSLHLEAPAGVSSEELYKPRENFWTVYCQIVEDLNIAEEKMRTYDEMKAISGLSSGRVCNYAATACRSLVYLTIGTLLEHPDDNFWVDRTPDFSEIGINSSDDAFRLALADALKVLPAEHGGTGGTPFALEEVYGDLFRWTEPSDWQSAERIWTMPRSPESNGAGSGLAMWALPNYYEGRENGANFGRCRPCRWFFQKWCETYGGIQGTDVGYNDHIYVDCLDPRMKTNIIYNEYVGKAGEPAQCYPSKHRVKMSADYPLKTGGIPFYKKYYDPTFNNSVGNADLYVMRLAEVYLIAAEASVYLGDTAAAIGYVNVILERARRYRDAYGNIKYATEPADWKAEDFIDDTALLDAIFWERCFEMPFEHHEYFDTHRMGANWIVRMISTPKNAFLALPEQTEGTSPYTGKFFGEGFKYDTDPARVRKGLINGYPFDELTYNPFLDINRHDPVYGQNPLEVFWQ